MLRPPHTMRLDFQALLGWVVEKGMQIEVPARAQVIRVLMDELTRVASHLLWWGAMAMDVGAITPFFHAFREREMINDIMEETCGARLTMNYMVPGGVLDTRRRIHRRFFAGITILRRRKPE